MGARATGEGAERASAGERECRALCRYLLGVDPTPYVVERYAAAHRARPDLGPRAPFDRWSVRLAAAPAVPVRAVDAYARIFHPRGLLRRKLALLLAILESSPVVYRRVDEVDPVTRPLLAARLAWQMILWLAALAAGTLALGPLHLLSRLAASPPRATGGVP